MLRCRRPLQALDNCVHTCIGCVRGCVRGYTFHLVVYIREHVCACGGGSYVRVRVLSLCADMSVRV